jgi:protoporphyrinogen oxidase
LPDPYTSVLVLNIGAERGISCPDDHWVYLPKSNSGFHRVGFYSNIEKQFLPTSSNAEKQKVSLYVERAYAGGAKPSITEIEKYKTNVIAELQTLGFIGKPDIVDPTWIEVAYTWKNANSRWVEEVIRLLRNRNIYSIGRYGKWRFQGIAQSLLEGYDFSLPKHES